MTQNPPLVDGKRYDNIGYLDRRTGLIRYTQQTAIYRESDYMFVFEAGYEMPVTRFSYWSEARTTRYNVI